MEGSQSDSRRLPGGDLYFRTVARQNYCAGVGVGVGVDVKEEALSGTQDIMLDASHNPIGNGARVAIGEAIADAVERYRARHPQSASLFAQAQLSMPGGNTRSALYWDPFPLYVDRSWDARLRDVDGHDYIDFLGEYTAGLYGHGSDVLRDAVSDALVSGVSNAAPAKNDTQLADLICGRFPAVDKVRFCNSGTEATLYALALARRHTGRGKFIAFNGAYHGGVFIFADGVHPMNAPFDWTVCRYNDVESARATIRSIGSELAAVIVEPMMSNGGCIPADTGFLQALREECSAVGGLLIFDEIVTSRMGPAGVQGLSGVNPDLTTFGKYIGGGFSFGAFGGKAEILDLMDPRRPDSLPHAGTFNNNVFSMTVGARAMANLFTPERASRLFEDGETLRRRLNAAMKQGGGLAQFTGLGSTMNIHFVNGTISCPEDCRSEPRELFRLFHLDMLEAGIYLAPRGQINLSLPMVDVDFDRLVAAIADWLDRRRLLIAEERGAD